MLTQLISSVHDTQVTNIFGSGTDLILLFILMLLFIIIIVIIITKELIKVMLSHL